MKYLRPALGALLGLYVLRSLFFFGLTVAHMAGLTASAQYGALIDAFAAWQVVLWGVAIVAYIIATLRLFRGGKALIPLAAGLVLDTAFYMMIKDIPAYATSLSAMDQQIDLYGLAALVVVALVTWWTERSAPAPAAA
jgi:hypothetical protein